jgi:hypothetical protein
LPGTISLPELGEHLFTLPLRNRTNLLLYILAIAVSLPLGYSLFSWSKKTYSFLALYRPEQLFQETDDPSAPIEHKKTEILHRLNAEIEQDSHINEGQESWLLARLDGLWRSVRRYVAPSGEEASRARATSRRYTTADRHIHAPSEPTKSQGATEPEPVLQNVLALATDPTVIENVSRDARRTPDRSQRTYKPLLTVPVESLAQIAADERGKPEDWLYRFESLKGVRTNSMICQFSESLALEGTVEASPVGDTDPDLSDFGFRTVHALNFLRDRPTPALMSGRDGVHSGYPVSYGIGLNYQVSPLVNLRFDYAHETPNDYFVEYNGSWESSLVTNYTKNRTEDALSVHSFFVGLRYLHQQKANLIPLHTGFFYSTNMNDDPLASNVSLGFSIGGGVNRRDVRLGLAYRFRIWDNPEDQFFKERDMEELETRLSNQVLFTIVF